MLRPTTDLTQYWRVSVDCAV